MTLHDHNLNAIPAKPQAVAAESFTNIGDTNSTAKTCTPLHLCSRCGQPASSEFCPVCGHRQCLTCGE